MRLCLRCGCTGNHGLRASALTCLRTYLHFRTVLYPLPPKPRTPPRVVVTGVGVVTGLGTGWQANAEGFRAGQTSFRPVSRFDVSRQRVKVAAEADGVDVLPKTLLASRELMRLDPAARLLLLATVEAWQQSRWSPSSDVPFVIGTTSGGMSKGEEYYRQAVNEPKNFRGQATRVSQYPAHLQVMQVSRALGFSGPVTIIANACASGGNAIGHAWHLLRRGLAERALTGGYDGMSHLVFSGFDSLLALSPTRCRPFDAKRDGLALGEGAAVLALETLASAERRGVPILGEIIGYGATTDAHHLTQPHPQGDAAHESMTLACASAEVLPGEIDYINAHGTGTLLNDNAEAQAINRWAGDKAESLWVSSTKASIGHLLGAAGAVEAAVCLMTLREQWLPPMLSVTKPDPICRFRLVRAPISQPVNCVLSNSFGFGGANATLIFRRWTA